MFVATNIASDGITFGPGLSYGLSKLKKKKEKEKNGEKSLWKIIIIKIVPGAKIKKTWDHSFVDLSFFRSAKTVSVCVDSLKT